MRRIFPLIELISIIAEDPYLKVTQDDFSELVCALTKFNIMFDLYSDVGDTICKIFQKYYLEPEAKKVRK